MKKEMLINVLQPEECRIAIVEDGVLEELYVERASQESYVGNIYKGKIVNIEPGIQAAFVDFGIGRNGFLHVTDVDPIYYKHLLPREMQEQLDRMEDDDRASRQARGRGGRDRNGGRGRRERQPEGEANGAETSAEFTSFLPPEVGGIPAPVEVEGEAENEGLEEDEGFFEGLDAVPPSAPPIRRMPMEVTSVVEPPKAIVQAPKAIPAPTPVAAIVESDGDGDDEDDDDDGGFASGLDFEDEVKTAAPAAPRVEPESESEGEPEIEVEVEVDAEAEKTNPDEGEKKPKRSGPKKAAAKPGKKASATEKDKDKAKAKPKKTKKKDDDDGSKPMPAAERRSSDDDDPEIRPFFTDDDGSFDINASNDRFAGPSEPTEGEDGEPVDPLEFGPPRDPNAAKEFTDEDLAELDAAAERRFRENDEDRRRRTGGGDRGGRGGPRGRGDRGDRPQRSGDRPDRPAGERGPRGPGGPPQNKAHTRHKGLPIPKIQDIFKKGQEVIVQVIKEGIGTKGPALSTFISVAGRYLVLMPSLNRVGVSKKIEDRDTRHRLRDTMNALNPPEGIGFIVRTAAVDRDADELKNDMLYLLRLWQVVVRRIKRPGPVEVYRESDMITRTIRDIFSSDIDTIYVDEEKAFAGASEFLQIVMPKYAGRIRYYGEVEPLFHRYGLEDEIAKINQKRIDLPGGGSIIIEQTEALVSIDVNSGNFRAEGHLEETAFQMNQRAAKEIARQLRLRDLGGVIVNDFIDMRSEHHRRQVEETLRTALRRDRAKTKILRISEFGLIEMTRQRIQPSLKKRIYNDCPHCAGTGFVKTSETMGIDVMRLLQLAAHRCPPSTTVTVTVHTDVAIHLLNRKRGAIAELEAKAHLEVTILGQAGVSPDLCTFRCVDANGSEVRLFGAPPMRGGRLGTAGGGGNGGQGGHGGNGDRRNHYEG